MRIFWEFESQAFPKFPKLQTISFLLCWKFHLFFLWNLKWISHQSPFTLIKEQYYSLSFFLHHLRSFSTWLYLRKHFKWFFKLTMLPMNFLRNFKCLFKHKSHYFPVLFLIKNNPRTFSETSKNKRSANIISIPCKDGIVWWILIIFKINQMIECRMSISTWIFIE